ncbi:MAG: metallophosphoesterase [Planctomycetota bacterium]
MAYGHVISDLHLLTPWSAAEEYLAEMQEAAGRSDFFVLNGDIFDFRWSELSTIDRSVDAAIDWLRAFMDAAPRCRLIYVLGNHDNLRDLAGRLDELQAEGEHFDWRPSHVRIGSALFTHGDLLLRADVVDPFRRRLQPSVVKKSKTLSRVYHLLHTMRMHRWYAPVYGERRLARRMVRAMDRAGNGVMKGVTDVYFGHVHMRFTDFNYRGLTFHNTGSVINGLPWHMLEVDVET